MKCKSLELCASMSICIIFYANPAYSINIHKELNMYIWHKLFTKIEANKNLFKKNEWKRYCGVLGININKNATNLYKFG